MARKKQITKMFASSMLLITVALIYFISKKQPLLAQKPGTFPVNTRTLNYDHVNEYGSIVSTATDQNSQATVEHIALHSPKTRNSKQKIVRFGRLIRYKNAKATILICHGFMTDKHDVAFLRHMFPEGKYNFMTFDFRAHGENCQGQRCTLGRDEALDVITATKFIKEHPHIGKKPVIVYAFSMGAVASIEAQAQDKSLFHAMILDCPFDSSENMVKRCLESVQFSFLGYDFSIPACRFLQKYAFHPYVQYLIKGILKTISHFDTKNIDIRVYPIAPAVSAQKITVPCFFIHCKNDEKIAVDAIREIYTHAGSSYKKLWLTNGRRHFDSYFYNPEKYIKEIHTFIDQSLNNQLAAHEQVMIDPDEIFVQI